MKLPRYIIPALMGALFLMAETGVSAANPFTGLRKQALEAYNRGDYADAEKLYASFMFDPALDDAGGTSDFYRYVGCLVNLNRDPETDALREKFFEAHSDSWPLVQAVAESYRSANHQGFIVAGTFERGHHRGGGESAHVFERDRIRSLQLYEHALGLLADLPQSPNQAGFYQQFAANYLQGRGHQSAWKLNLLSDTSTLPDPEPGYPYAYWSGGTSGAPVDADNRPRFHALPDAYDTALSDGERWRWLLWKTMEVGPGLRSSVYWTYATFLHQQFGVQTMADYGWYFHRARTADSEDADRNSSGTYQLHTLGDDETIARLATGIQRFSLPDEFNYLKIFKDLANGAHNGYEENAHQKLAEIYANRRQYPTAARWWRVNIKKYGDHSNRWKGKQLDQITDNWGRFESTLSHPAGDGPLLQYTFRNGDSVAFTAERLRIPTLIKDMQNYLRANPTRLDGQRININGIGYRIVRENEKKYVGERVAKWTVKLKPAPGHFDRRIDIPTPLSDPGAYLVTARMSDGNVSKIIVWVNDTVIVKKPLAANDKATKDTPAWYYIADARTGAPVAGATVEFFAYWQKHLQHRIGKRFANIRTTRFAETSDAQGQVFPTARDLRPGDQDPAVIAIATTEDGRFAFHGFSQIWTPHYHDAQYNQTKAYALTDRPVYRPGDAVKFKTWMRYAKYDQDDTSAFAGKSLSIHIRNPQGEEVYSHSLTADAFGGAHAEHLLPDDAALGVYSLQVGGYGSATFRVEEYKKPEFEVIIDAPDKPVMLGETIPITLQADYYFGAPVTHARVSYKITRTAHTATWYPPAPWDWFYGPGYWWFGYDYPWYPGWRHWGCERPYPFWWPQQASPPEIVAEGETVIGEDGSLALSLDTAAAQAMHGDQDHRYAITAEVTDNSRRTIVGTGEILVARRPFKVYAWVDRGYYRVGDVVKADFNARTLAGVPVTGTGEATLYRVTYDSERQPVETAAQTWQIDPNVEGQARLQLTASQAGQYRIAYQLTDADDHTIEGGYVFVVRGQRQDGRAFRFSQLELITDRSEYADGESVELLINTDAADSTVALFIRPANNVYLKPRILSFKGQSHTVSIPITQKDMPNFFVEALTVRNGQVHTEVREIVVPPAERVLDVAVTPSAETYGPGETASLEVKVTDTDGTPFTGSLALAVYDRSLDYIAGGARPPDIREFFWKWRRTHQPFTEHSFQLGGVNLVLKDKLAMGSLGVFGATVANDEDLLRSDSGARYRSKSAPQSSRMLGDSMMMMKEGAAAGMAFADAAAPMEMAEGRSAGGRDESGQAAPDFMEAAVRSEFADTAHWAPALVTDEAGTATVEFTMPENLTGWSIRTWAVGHGTKVGEQSARVTTKKNLLLRLQAPRFFVEKDEVVLSANIHNDLAAEKTVRAILELEGDTLEPIDATTRDITIPAGGEARVDWRVKAVAEGDAVVRMKALTDEESDGMQMTFPVFVHGIEKTMSFSTAIRPQDSEATLTLVVPEERRPEQTRLEVRYSPSLAAALVDALPYLVEYPYGCTEQTLSRFLPTVLTQKILVDLGIDLEAVRTKQTNLNAQEIGDSAERAAQWKRYQRNPVFDEAVVDDMVKEGLKALYDMQIADGGWGWFHGARETSTPHTTAYVVHGLQLAKANGLAIIPGVLDRGVTWLERYQKKQIKALKDPDGKNHADALDAFIFMVLADADVVDRRMYEFLVKEQAKLPVYAKAMFALTCDTLGETAVRDAWQHTIEQHLVEDAENQTAYLDLPNGSYWWYWYGSEYEAHAYYLKLLARTEPDSDKARGLVKYLLNNRKHGTYWNSTRDTAVCIEAMAEYLKASGEDQPNLTVELRMDGELKKSVTITPETLFTFDNQLVLEGADLAGGEHTLTLHKTGTGPLYANAYLTVFTLEDPITAAGLEIKVNRAYYRLTPVDASTHVAGHRGQAVSQKVEKYEREPLASLDAVTSGDLIEIELTIESKNDYEYLVFEDRKPAGLEPVEVRSGYTGNALGAYVEFRDERVAFFVKRLARGRHSVAYRMRAEIPGTYSALPAHGYAMYAPELKTNADEFKITVEDQPPVE